MRSELFCVNLAHLSRISTGFLSFWVSGAFWLFWGAQFLHLFQPGKSDTIPINKKKHLTSESDWTLLGIDVDEWDASYWFIARVQLKKGKISAHESEVRTVADASRPLKNLLYSSTTALNASATPSTGKPQAYLQAEQVHRRAHAGCDGIPLL